MGTLFPTGRMFGDKCRTDYECAEKLNLVCSKNELRTCHCRRGYIWNMMNKICYRIKEYPYDNGMQLRASFYLEAVKIPTSLFTSSTQQSPSWEAIRFSASQELVVLIDYTFLPLISQEIPCILWKPEVDYRVYKNPPPVPVMSQINLFHATHPQSHVNFQLLGLYQRISPDPRPIYPFRQKASFTAWIC